jgi:hypothetical protein
MPCFIFRISCHNLLRLILSFENVFAKDNQGLFAVSMEARGDRGAALPVVSYHEELSFGAAVDKRR